MFTITWITPARRLESISTPRRGAAVEVYARMRRQGVAARLWLNGSRLVM